MMKLGNSRGEKIYSRIAEVFLVLAGLFFPVLSVAGAETAGNNTVQTYYPGELLIAVAIIITGAISGYWFYRHTRARVLLAEREDELAQAREKISGLEKKIAGRHDIITHDLTVSERFHSKLIEVAIDGISYYDRNNNLILANDAFYSVLGYSKDELERLPSEEILHPDDKNFEKKNLDNVLRDGISRIEIMVRHKDGHYVCLSTKSVLIKNGKGEPMGYLMISRDVTEQKRAEQELIAAKEMAEASNRIKTSFLANISHEVRTPLNSIVGFSNLLLMKDISDEQREEYIDLINANSDKLLQVIGDIIDLSRLESSQMEISYDETSVSSLVSEAINEAKVNILRSEKPVTLTVLNQMGDVSDVVFTDKMWLKRIMRHLLDNAVKFTMEGEISLTYFYDNKELVFSVRDTGIGINKANIERIFDEFNQEVSGHHRPFEGLGLGLSLAKQVLDKMGGKISVFSEKGVGSVFTFTIPYRQAGSSKHGSEENISRPKMMLNRIKCLIIDNNKDVLIYVTRILVDTGVQIVTSCSGRDAVNILETDPGINMVLMDMQIPGIDSAELITSIRNIRHNIPIIAQTSFVLGNNNDVLKAGCDACLVKPIRRDNLLSVISSFTFTA